MEGLMKFLGAKTNPERCLVVAPHPDDEIIGLFETMTRLLEVGTCVDIVYMTNGAPSKEDYYPNEKGFTNRAEYAEVRKNEAIKVAEHLGIRESNLSFLEFDDVDLCSEIFEATKLLSNTIKQRDPVIIFTCPYDGSHPDHDATRFIVEQASISSCFNGALVEYALYNHSKEQEIFNEFIDKCQTKELVIHISERRKARKRFHLKMYASQQKGIISRVTLDKEMLRLAPPYDFKSYASSRPLYYEKYFSLPVSPDEVTSRICEYLSLQNP